MDIDGVTVDTVGAVCLTDPENVVDSVDGSQVNRGTASYTFQNGKIQFAFTNDDGTLLESNEIQVGDYQTSKLRFNIAAFADSPRFIDNVRVVALPEPSSLTIFGTLSVAIVGWFARRRLAA